MSIRSLLPIALAAGTSASVLPRTPSPGAGFLSFPINHVKRETTLARRDDDVTLYNVSTIAYMVQLDIGTPAQSIMVQIDTGSDELWVDPDCSNVSNQDSSKLCSSLGTYDPQQSSTVQDLGESKDLAYGLGKARIEYITDDITIPGSTSTKLKSVQFGYATASEDAAVPIMGIGFGSSKNLDYRNIIDELQAQGVTASRAFSLALGSATQKNGGVVIFGGVDTKKFTGKLHQYSNLPPQAGEEGLWRYWIQLDTIGITKPGSSGSSAYASSSTAIVLDSGSSYSYLPDAVMTKLAADFGSSVGSDSSVPVQCSTATQGGTVDFTFAGLTIKVPYKEFIRQLDATTCELAANPVGTDGTPILGDSFLRSAYVVFDQDNEQIYMAPYANCGSNEQTLPAGQGAAGNMTGQCSSSGASSGPVRNMWLALACFAGLQVLMAFA